MLSPNRISFLIMMMEIDRAASNDRRDSSNAPPGGISPYTSASSPPNVPPSISLMPPPLPFSLSSLSSSSTSTLVGGNVTPASISASGNSSMRPLGIWRHAAGMINERCLPEVHVPPTLSSASLLVTSSSSPSTSSTCSNITALGGTISAVSKVATASASATGSVAMTTTTTTTSTTRSGGGRVVSGDANDESDDQTAFSSDGSGSDDDNDANGLLGGKKGTHSLTHADLYKTEICHNWYSLNWHGEYGATCRHTHIDICGLDRQKTRNCSYGNKCHYGKSHA
jgi:hypothetical protein